MAESMNSLARRGLVSSKGVQNAILNSTKVQKSKMTTFDSKVKDEGNKDFDGHANFGTGQINSPAVQRDRAPGGSMPSRKTGGKPTGIIGSGNRSQSKQGGAVMASQTPKRSQIDKFPGKQAKTFPAGAGMKASKGFTGNTKMKGAKPLRSGGPYGGPNSRAAG
jgi:hypothetical protein